MLFPHLTSRPSFTCFFFLVFVQFSSVFNTFLKLCSLNDINITDKLWTCITVPDSLRAQSVWCVYYCYSCVWTKCATTACLLASNTVCLLGIHAHVRSDYIKLSLSHTHIFTQTCPLQSYFPSVVWSIDEFRHSRGGYVPLSCYRGDWEPRPRSGCHWLQSRCYS